jgi:two-component system, chemotaxis family, protein-glutamate methylesterase/glutaminase
MSIAVVAPSPGSAPAVDPIRVMVVDDAVVVRGMISRWVEAEPDMQVVASLGGGRDAIDQLERRNPDVVILDVTMPDIDGIRALPRLLEKKRDLVVIMASTLTRRNAEISLRALSLGAADYIPKPETNREITTSASFQRELIDKIRALGSRRKRGSGAARAIAPAVPVGRRSREADLDAPSIVAGAAEPARILLRPSPATVPRVLLIGASTGGPQALNAMLAVVGSVIDHAPVLVTQHMPPTFTAILAEHFTRSSGRPASEATDGEPIHAGRIYVARGGLHMRVVRSIRCSRRRQRFGALGPWRSYLPAWARTARAAPPTSWLPAAVSSRRTKPRAWSGACPAQSCRPAWHRRCFRSIRSGRASSGYFREAGRDTA